jgi:hypothetical protein
VNTEIATAARRSTPRVPRVLVWLVVNVVSAYLLLYPLALGELVVRHLLAGILDAPWSPFGSDTGDLQAGVLGCLLLGGPLLILVVAANRAIRRPHQQNVVFWAVTTAVLVAPTVVSGLLDLTFQEMFGKGLLW